MNDWKNDPRLTAYALNELDATEQAEIEGLLLKDNSAARDEIEAIRRTSALLQSELAGKPVKLNDLQKARVSAAAVSHRRWWTRPLTVAASLLLAIGLPATMLLVSHLKNEAPTLSLVGSEPTRATREVWDQIRASNPNPKQFLSPQSDTAQSEQAAPIGALRTRADRLVPNGSPEEGNGAEISAAGHTASAPRTPSKDSAKVSGSSNGYVKRLDRVYPMSEQVREMAAPAQATGGSSKGNSLNYTGRDGQEVLQGDSHVSFEKLPDVGSPTMTASRHIVSSGWQRGSGQESDEHVPAKRRHLQGIDYSWARPTPPTTESYEPIKDNDFARVTDQPLSTFSIDVDTASYANVRRFITAGQLPPPDAVRIEELINYFTYDYTPPKGDDPFSLTIDVAACPWDKDHRLARIGLKGKVLDENRPACNLVFLMDVSGSMAPENRLPMLKQAMKMLVRKLRSDDRVAIVTYAGTSGLALPSTSCAEKQPILDAFDRLSADGSTNGGEGIQMAYRVAQENFLKGGVNRVILATDGDFNVGVTDRSQLIDLVKEKARGGVFLTVLGVGMGNYKDATLEQLADKGNGNYAYLDTMAEARKVLVDQMGGTLVTIAKDVKIQIEFNPGVVGAYRLIGYENRMLAAQDFNNDRKDAGEIGAGHTVTALYEIVPTGKLQGLTGVDPLKYQSDPTKVPPPAQLSTAAKTGEMMTVKLRYKQPDGQSSKLIERPITDYLSDFTQASEDFRFAAAVAAYGMLLRNSPFAGEATFDLVQDLAGGSIGKDPNGYRAEFLELVGKTKALSKGRP